MAPHCRVWVESQSPPLESAADLAALGPSAADENSVTHGLQHCSLRFVSNSNTDLIRR